jgi:predicted 2-oxoglutarate/Fe(II)-dependent dioxygenase YbiX
MSGVLSTIRDWPRPSVKGSDDTFALHQDGIYQDPQSGDRSTTTLSVFLNDDYAGGETEFFQGTNLRNARSAFVAQPEAGKGVLFPREVYHKGNRVDGEAKYLLRTDLMQHL